MIHTNSINEEASGSKRKALDMISSIFSCKKPKESENNRSSNSHSLDRPYSNHNQSYRHDSLSSTNATDFHEYLPKSPISPRVKNIHEDMEALTLSRQDNPYIIQQLEKLSMASELMSEIGMSSLSPHHKMFIETSTEHSFNNGRANLQLDPIICMDTEENTKYEQSLHEKLIRSPPPMFPHKVSCFLFPAGAEDSPARRRLLSPTFISNHANINPDKTASSSSERRVSDSSITFMQHQWHNQHCDQSLTASSASLLPASKENNRLEAQKNPDDNQDMISCLVHDDQQSNNCAINSTRDRLVQANNESVDSIDSSCSFISPSNSHEALLMKH